MGHWVRTGPETSRKLQVLEIPESLQTEMEERLTLRWKRVNKTETTNERK